MVREDERTSNGIAIWTEAHHSEHNGLWLGSTSSQTSTSANTHTQEKMTRDKHSTQRGPDREHANDFVLSGEHRVETVGLRDARQTEAVDFVCTSEMQNDKGAENG